MSKRIFCSYFAAALFAACSGPLPERSSEEHSQAVRSFYVGLAALDVGDDRRALDELQKTVALAPGEPAAWNNLGVLQLRQRDLESSRRSLDEAAKIEPGLAVVRLNQAMLALQEGDTARAAADLEKVLELEPDSLNAVFLLADLRERETENAEALRLYRRISALAPENLAAKLEVARLEAKLDLGNELKETVAGIKQPVQGLSDEAREQFTALTSAAAKEDTRAAVSQVSFLRNILLREAWFRNAIAEFKTSDTTIGRPIDRPLRLASPDFSPAEPDTGLAFVPEKTDDQPALFAKPIFLNGDDPSVIVRSAGDRIMLGELTFDIAVSMPEQMAAFDLDYDFRNDLAFASDKGFRLFRQDENGTFTEITASTRLAPAILNDFYTGVWPLDVEHDGDLDLLLARNSGPPVVLQNNSDGSFTALRTFETIENVLHFAYADIDEDGDADAVFLTADGKLRIFQNEREGIFEERSAPAAESIAAFTIGDLNGDGILEIVTFGDTLSRHFLDTTGEWRSSTLNDKIPEIDCRGKGPDAPPPCRIFVADFDNNGANDILISSASRSVVLYLDADGQARVQDSSIDSSISGIADTNGNGRLDLVGVAPDGTPQKLINHGTRDYHWQILRPRAAKTEGDQRVNSFGIGGEMELRTGIRTQKQLITAPQVHFGLGEDRSADVLRVIWGNGVVQAEFDLKSDQAVLAEQRLKGSCPHLFTWNGERFVMVKDAPPWSPALGLKINAQETYGILQTEEWFKIPGEHLRPLNEHYELRITGEYWESFYLDNYQLLVVDHPEDTEVFTDERFAIPLPPLKVFSTQMRQPFSMVIDHKGNDVSGMVRDLDEKYLDSLDRGKFQGVAKDHWVEFLLPPDAPVDEKLLLIADGWVHPTDASINVQLGQSSFTPPQSLSLEVPHKNGEWRTVRSNLGFPAGKMKTVIIELPTGETRFRLRTNMEIFWDRLAWAVEIPDAGNKITRLDLAEAELGYRGFSVIEKADPSSPEKPDYNRILTTNQRWRDLEGYYTRFGDVKELLAEPDDRIVLMNAGDELVLRFAALPEPRPGLKRDFVIIGNGWIKDGDLNSVFSRTLLPLPTRLNNDYTRRPTRLEDDPVYIRHRSDWVKFHTRYVSPDGFRNSVRR